MERTTMNELKSIAESKLRPTHPSGWVTFSGEMKDQLKQAFGYRVDDTEYTCEGAGWVQEAERLQEVRNVSGTLAHPDTLAAVWDVEKRRTLASHRLQDLQVR